MKFRVAPAANKAHKKRAGINPPFFCSSWRLAKLVHGVVRTTGLQGRVASKVFFVVVAHVGASHVLVLDAGDTLTDLLALNAFNNET